MTIKQLILIILFVFCGGLCGYFFWWPSHYCLEINAPKVPFYFHFAQQLKKELLHLGYSFSCPAYFPKTSIQFVQVNQNQFWAPEPHTGILQTNIAIIGDCFEMFNVNVFDKYDLLIPINEYHHGYLSQFNYKTAFFPLFHFDNQTVCNTDYYRHKIDVSAFAAWTDALIQGMNYEKL